MEKHLANEQLAAFLAGELKAEARGRVRGHLLNCRSCTLAFSHVVAESMTPELRAKFQRPMPRPPAAVLEALGVWNEREGMVWTALQALEEQGIVWARQELQKVRETLEKTVLSWFFTRVVSGSGQGLGTRGAGMPTLGPDEEWPQQIDVKVVDAAGQPLGRTVRFEVIQPPTVTPAGEFLLTMRTQDARVAGWSLHCTVTAGEQVQVKVTFTGELYAEVNDGGCQVTVRGQGLPVPEPSIGPVIIPAESVDWSLRERQR